MQAHRTILLSRRTLIAGIGGATVITALGATAETRLRATPAQTEGPFYPVDFPEDVDSDLLRIGSGAPARGEIVHLSGHVRTIAGEPVAGARVEIWQCDHSGIYRHPRDSGFAQLYRNFQGFGRTMTGADGSYAFRTIKPVPYSGRTPHIHFAVAAPGHARLVTQMYLAGEPRNARDFLFRNLGDAQSLVTVAFQPAPTIEPNALAGRFDIVLG
jgi:protocatechuate 3,4-dioxygenase beta subunit